MDGYVIAKGICKQPTAKRPFLVAVTSHDDEEDRRNSKLRGIHLQLAKPVESGQLARYRQSRVSCFSGDSAP
jgi:CheY-like chemotaxis protein